MNSSNDNNIDDRGHIINDITDDNTGEQVD